jgi:hypothetical protein
MPSVFTGTSSSMQQDATALRANAFGALTELDALMTKQGPFEGRPKPTVSYPGLLQPVVLDGAPFRNCYLVGNRTTAGSAVTNRNEILERAAMHVHISIASALTAAGEQSEDNIALDIGSRTETHGRAVTYSSFTCEWLELPTQRVSERWRRIISRRLLERLGSMQGSRAAAPMKALERESFTVLEGLVTGRLLGKFVPAVGMEKQAFTSIGASPRSTDDLIQTAQYMETAASRHMTNAPELDVLLAKVADDLAPEMQQEVARALAQASIEEVRAGLREIRERLAGWQVSAAAAARIVGQRYWPTAAIAIRTSVISGEMNLTRMALT